MIDAESKLRKLYKEYRNLVNVAEEKQNRSDRIAGMFLVRNFLGKRFRQECNLAKRGAEVKSDEIIDTIRMRLGFYHLTECHFSPNAHPIGRISGFIYGFNYLIGEHDFQVTFFSQGPIGILAQKHESDYPPQIEIRREHPHNVLHLPKGFVIPAGPYYFKEDSIPMDEKTQEKKVKAVQDMLDGLNSSERCLFMAGGLSDYLAETRIYHARYFNWKPNLPDTPKYIHFDVKRHHPRSWGLTPETVPTYEKTVAGMFQESWSTPADIERVAQMCQSCKLLN